MSRRNENAQTGYFGEELAEHLQPNLVVGWLVEGLSEKINWRLGPSEKMRKRFSRAHTQLFEQGKQWQHIWLHPVWCNQCAPSVMYQGYFASFCPHQAFCPFHLAKPGNPATGPVMQHCFWLIYSFIFFLGGGMLKKTVKINNILKFCNYFWQSVFGTHPKILHFIGIGLNGSNEGIMPAWVVSGKV